MNFVLQFMFGESQISPLNKDGCISPFDCQPFHPAYLPFTNDATSATPCSVCPRMFSSLVDMSGAWIMCGVKACSGEDMSEVPVQFCNTHFLIFHSCRMM